MLVFLIIGGVGVVLLLIFLVVGDLLDGLFDFAGDLLSGAALAGLVGAFGFTGALILGITDSLPWAIGGGAVGGVLIGLAAGWFSWRLRHGGDEATVRTGALVGRQATVINPIPVDGYGEIRIIAAGQPTKLNARSSSPIDAGESVYITAVLSATSVTVDRLN
ncbi:NfeD family protein [Microlunatus speluncae]|uniref:NfeD family protein n=1 Tax=Microlunatus speluncae TaxID=2594267 RepID=UPI001375DDB5|nr:NfeD family protein [Microlunatus speluncae]